MLNFVPGNLILIFLRNSTLGYERFLYLSKNVLIMFLKTAFGIQSFDVSSFENLLQVLLYQVIEFIKIMNMIYKVMGGNFSVNSVYKLSISSHMQSFSTQNYQASKNFPNISFQKLCTSKIQ